MRLLVLCLILVSTFFGLTRLAIYRSPSVLLRSQLHRILVPPYPPLPNQILVHKISQPPIGPDPLVPGQWGLQAIGLFDAFNSMFVPMGPIVKPCQPIVIAVIDTGIDYQHPELTNSLWVNPGETGQWGAKGSPCRDKSCNQIDDDKNGFVDDVIGYDFVHDTGLPFDKHGHGTHISGIIGAASANANGIAGICPAVRIMALKYYDPAMSYSNLQNTIRAIEYATKMGAQIINYSAGGIDPSPRELMAIRAARDKEILMVVAAGNEGQDVTKRPYYPASYPLDNILQCAAVNYSGVLLETSNWGRGIALGAPGFQILSTLPSGVYGQMSGSSQATAFCTGVSALLMSQGHYGYREIIRALEDGSVPLKHQESGRYVRYGLLNVPGALERLRKPLPR